MQHEESQAMPRGLLLLMSGISDGACELGISQDVGAACMHGPLCWQCGTSGMPDQILGLS